MDHTTGATPGGDASRSMGPLKLSEATTRAARIVIVDDASSNTRLLTKLLHSVGFERVHPLNTSARAVELVTSVGADAILLDLRMPEMDGFEVMSALRSAVGERDMPPILVMTADREADTRQGALAQGAAVFLSKPFDLAVLVDRVGEILAGRIKGLRQRIQAVAHETDHGDPHRFAQQVAAEARAAHRGFERMDLAFLQWFACVAEPHHGPVGTHAYRVGRDAERLAKQLGMGVARSATIGTAAQLHDIGMVAVLDEVLFKADPLDHQDVTAITRHVHVGAELLSGGDGDPFKTAREVALHHHERWDGLGYPDGLAGHRIPFAARLVAVVDAFQSLTEPRAHAEGRTVEQALEHLHDGRGSRFDPEVVDSFMESLAP